LPVLAAIGSVVDDDVVNLDGPCELDHPVSSLLCVGARSLSVTEEGAGQNIYYYLHNSSANCSQVPLQRTFRSFRWKVEAPAIK